MWKTRFTVYSPSNSSKYEFNWKLIDSVQLFVNNCGRNVNKPSAPTEVEGKKTTALMWYYSPTKNKLIYQVWANTHDFWLSGQYGKYNSNIFLIHPLGLFPSKMMRCPWILCFDLLPLQYTDLTHQIWRFLVYIFLGGHKVVL